MTTLDDLPETLRSRPDRPALLTLRRGRVATGITCAELDALASAFAGGLHRRGLEAGDTVGFAVRPGARALALMLAASRLRLRIAVLDPNAGPEVLAARVATAAPRLIVADAAAQAVAGWARPLARRAHLALPDLRSMAPVATVGARLPWCAPPMPLHSGATPDRRGQDGDAVMIFTSGTTGSPRAVVHTWRSLDAGMSAVAELVQPRVGATVLGGTFFVLVPSLASGASVALPARSAGRLARQLRLLRPDETYLTPPQLRDALAAGARFSGRVWSGSAPVSAQLLARVRRAGATAAYGVYALTEMFPVAVVSAEEKAAFTGDGDLVGRLLPGVRARTDAAGQLLLAGPNAFDRYLGDDRTEWVATGDIGRLHDTPQGTDVVLAGRAKDMILRAAENIYPGLYEPSLHVPGVALAVLVGVPAGDGDERLVAIVETEPGVDEREVELALRPALARMGTARPDQVVFAKVPLAGRSRKPDRAAARASLTTSLAASLTASLTGEFSEKTRNPHRRVGSCESLWVVVPALDEAARIGDTLRALADQHDRDFRLLVVDNGSTDRTVDIVRAFAAAAPFPVEVVVEPERGAGTAADTGFRYAIAHGATAMLRTDADCLPAPDWVAKGRRALAAGAEMVCGRSVPREDEHPSPLERWGLPAVTRGLALYGRYRKAHRHRRYRTPYVLCHGHNLAITASLYLRCGGAPREPLQAGSEDVTLLNRAREHSDRVVRDESMTVYASLRRLRAWGVARTLLWSWDRRYVPENEGGVHVR